MAGSTSPADSFHFIGSKGNVFLDFVTNLDPKDRKPYFDMLTRLRLGDRTMIKGMAANGRPERMGMVELSDHGGGHRIYGVMEGEKLVVLGASGKGDQQAAISQAIEARKEYEQLKRQGKLDPTRHTKFHFHPSVQNGHMTVGGKSAHEFADRHGRPPSRGPQGSFNKQGRLGRLGVFLGALTTALGLAGQSQDYSLPPDGEGRESRIQVSPKTPSPPEV